MSTLPPRYIAQSEVPGSVVAQAGGRTTSTIAPEHKPNAFGDDGAVTNTASSRTPLIIAVVLLAVVAIGGVTLWQKRNGNPNGGVGNGSHTAMVAQVLQGVSHTAAYEWMVQTDRYSARTALSESRIRQRYAVVALTLSVATTTIGPNRDTSECTWTGVECETSSSSNSKSERVWRLQRSGNGGGQQIPNELATFLPHLRELSLTDRQLQGPLPESFPEELIWLELSRNLLTGTIPPSVWTLPNLRFLYLDGNQLTGRLERKDSSAELSTVSALRQVRIFANQLTGPLPTWLGELYQLEHWIAYENQFTGPALPSGQAPPPQLTYYDMSSNLLSGRIPPLLWATTVDGDEDATVPPLATIYLEHNQLTGPIPPSSQRIPTLQTLYLHNNTLTGTIPNNFATNWMELTELRLGTNALEGTLPTSLWSHPTLQRLDVQANQLQGALPSSSSSTALNDVQLQNNRFSGAVPTEFGYAWTQLQALRLDGNPDLTGTLGPEDGSDAACAAVWPQLLTLAADCRSLLVTDVPTITCECCTFCA